MERFIYYYYTIEVSGSENMYLQSIANSGSLVDGIKTKTPCLHFSIDDCISAFEDGFTNSYDSIFSVKPLHFVKEMHDLFGVKATLYLFYENRHLYNANAQFDLSMVDGRYQGELAECSDWLRLGVHALNYQTPMDVQTRVETYATIDKITTAIEIFAGKELLASTCRPHFYSAPRDACDILKDRGYNIMFSPEDDRKIANCLPPAKVKQLSSGGYYEDTKSGIIFLHTSFRAEDATKTADEMKSIIERDISKYALSAFYTHEYALMDMEKGEAVRHKIRELFTLAKTMGLQFVV